jgi:single-strand DNA-binding protein
MPYGDTPVTIAGNLTADPDLRYTTAGVAVAAFTIASSPRVWDQTAGDWRDGDTLFLRCSAWRQLAEHIADSLSKGARAVVTGRLRQRDYEAADGTGRTVYEVDVDDAGPSLRFATATITKTTRERHPHPPGNGQHPSQPVPASAGDPPF